MKILEFIKNNIVCLDGGMGTVLHSLGLESGVAPESWNISEPEKIISVHKAYFDAGSNIVATNTFGVNSLKYDDVTLERLIKSAVENCCKARELSNSTQHKFIALDIGPLGKLLKPFGDLDFDEAVEIFAKTIKIAADTPIDLILFETFTDIYETKAALLAAKENSGLPVFVTNAYGEDEKLITGATPEIMASLLESMGACAIGANCSFGPKQTLNIVKRIAQNTNLPIIMKPNAGLPRFIDGKTSYDVSCEKFAEDILRAVDTGISIVGGCCGTTPDYIKAVKEITAHSCVKSRPKSESTVVTSYCKAVKFDSRPVLIGERINPTGKKRFKQALLENDMEYILSEAFRQADKNVDILDVNVGLAGIDESEMLVRSVKEIQAVIDLPLQIDSADYGALENAMRIYNGKALINSVNAKKESMEHIFPLVKKYGGSIIALTLDENGIPETVQGRIDLAQKILCEAEKYGIDKNDIIFDPLAMTISTDARNAEITLECVRRITDELNCKTSLGISNISFGLPRREFLNSTFFALAMANGLSAGIINPESADLMNAYYSFCALNCKDPSFNNYIQYCTEDNDKHKNSQSSENASLIDAIYSGRKELSASLTADLLTSEQPLSVINEYIIPALDKTGGAFEVGKIYLPQLLMSAEAASSAFDVIKSGFENRTEGKCKVVLATVKGDIHDIGKNIVKLLLENYDYEVIDLGKDVPAEVVLNKVIECNAELLGLSALMTTTLDAMRETVALVKSKAPFCSVFVGGAVVNEEFAHEICADAYTKDAMESVRYAERVYSLRNQ